ncbi:hypothetical protein BJV82DRAFT_708897 [Fennellomyces sp. T-0311]|nr:hypothetical protein BJV82DRAFT_708897 [Fennellomyces sp. T-0311]
MSHHTHRRRRSHRKTQQKEQNQDEHDEREEPDEELEYGENPITSPPPVVTLTPSIESVEPRSPTEQRTFEELNKVASSDEEVPHALIIQPKPTHNKLSPIMHNKTPVRPSSTWSSESEDIESTGSSQADLLAEDLKEHQRELIKEDRDEDLYVDPQLIATTERNRSIPSPERASPQFVSYSSSLRHHHRRLVFTEPVVSKNPDRVHMTQFYGKSIEQPTLRHKSRLYLVACDFSKESHSAMEWTMGTIMRDGDELHLVTVVSQEQDLAELEMAPAKEILGVAQTLNTKAKVLMGHMLLFDVKLVVSAVRGHVRDVLMTKIQDLPVTMVVCGCRGRSTMKGMLMGSVSTFLIHKSPVPVTVIRYRKKKKHHSRKKSETRATGLSESMRTGHLIVDELGAAR